MPNLFHDLPDVLQRKIEIMRPTNPVAQMVLDENTRILRDTLTIVQDLRQMFSQLGQADFINDQLDFVRNYLYTKPSLMCLRRLGSTVNHWAGTFYTRLGGSDVGIVDLSAYVAALDRAIEVMYKRLNADGMVMDFSV